MFLSYTVQLHVDCPKCETALGVNGPCDAVTCHVCKRVTELPETFWRKRFEPDAFDPHGARAGDTEASNVVGIGGIGCNVRYGIEDPCCGGCRAPLEIAALVGAADTGSLACPACAREIRVRRAEAIAELISRHARYLVGERATTETIEAFHVVCELDADAFRELRWQDAETRAADAAGTELSPALYAQLAGDDDYQVRLALAGNVAAPADVLGRLAGDADDEVVAAIAANPTTPSDALASLVRESDNHEAIVAIGSRAELPPVLVEALAAARHPRTRRHAAFHPNLSHATLRALTKDRDASVASAAKQRIADLEKAGVVVPGKPGFFGRLFGG